MENAAFIPQGMALPYTIRFLGAKHLSDKEFIQHSLEPRPEPFFNRTDNRRCVVDGKKCYQKAEQKDNSGHTKMVGVSSYDSA